MKVDKCKLKVLERRDADGVDFTTPYNEYRGVIKDVRYLQKREMEGVK